MNSTSLVGQLATIDSTNHRNTHVAKNVAVPIDLKLGPMKINNEATHAATVQRKRIFRSRALKWSSHPGNFLCVRDSDTTLDGMAESSALVAGEASLGGATWWAGFDIWPGVSCFMKTE